MGSLRKPFQQVLKMPPAAGADSRFNAQNVLIRSLFAGSIGRNCATWRLFETCGSIFLQQHAIGLLPNFGQYLFRIIKHLVRWSSDAAGMQADKGAGERVNFLSPRRRVMLCFACELVCVMVLGEAFANSKFFSEAGD
jgi:hypothetical protein